METQNLPCLGRQQGLLLFCCTMENSEGQLVDLYIPRKWLVDVWREWEIQKHTDKADTLPALPPTALSLPRTTLPFSLTLATSTPRVVWLAASLPTPWAVLFAVTLKPMTASTVWPLRMVVSATFYIIFTRIHTHTHTRKSWRLYPHFL